MRRLLLLDDEPMVLSALARELRQHFPPAAMRIETFSDPFAALQRVAECSFDIALSDLRMPLMSGATFLHALRDGAPATVRMILSASTDFASVSGAIAEAQVFRYIAKPWQITDLCTAIVDALAHRDEVLAELHLADRQRMHDGVLSPRQLEEKLLEEEEPGLLKVKWGPNGEIIL